MRKFFVLVSIFFCFGLQAQTNKAVDGLFKQAAQLYYYQDYNEARKTVWEILKIDSLHTKSIVLLATIYMETAKYEDAAVVYKKAVRIGIDDMPYVYFDYANVLFMLEDYKNAEINYSKYIKTATEEKDIRLANLQLESCKFAQNAIKNPVDFKPINLGSGVNSSYDEYLPSISPDESTLVITRKLPSKDPYAQGQRQEDFYICSKSGESWSVAKPIPGNLNTYFNEGAQTLSSDGNVMFFTACSRKEGVGSCDIYYAVKYNGQWTKAINAGEPLNTEAWESQPSLSSDNTTLYFSSNREGGFGGLDLYKAKLKPDGSFETPVNLGPQINSEFDESGPYIHPDNKTLYFTSNGWPGMGGMDLFMSKLNEKGEWTKPVNLGYPINTFNNEASIALNAKGNMAFISSSREGGRGGIDIYSFELYEKARPTEVTYLKGVVYDSETLKKLGAKFELIDLETSKIIIESTSSSANGEFLVCVPTDKDYALNVSKDGYLFFSENFTFSKLDAENKPYVKDIPLQAIKSGVSIILKNVFFDSNSYTLKNQSKAELLKLVDFMKKNNEVAIEISGHTDDIGKDETNLLLSENRAKAVFDYLVSNGVDKSRLSAKGYGETKPITPNDSDQARAKNRRTEFTIK
ncbi:MAG: OmpA family protein [Bacteroidales bacterium]|nr:OmpA family protein [Bacteroidales bacterium]